MKTVGELEGNEKNRYWQIRLPGFSVMGSRVWDLFLYLATLFMVIPLFLISKYFSTRLKGHIRDGGEHIGVPYHYFTEIYPGCVYSPFVKGCELELFRDSNIIEPVLEIGIGDGYFSSLLFESAKKRLAYGADLILGTLKSATRYNTCHNYLVMDGLEIPLPDGSLGTVIMNNVMHHLPDRRLVLDEVLRVLKKDGRFLFTENTIGWGLFTWEQLLLRKLKLNWIADKLFRFKLKLLAQELLVDDKCYKDWSKEGQFEIIREHTFVAKTAMCLSSVFEFLNLKQGQPTSRQMLGWLNLFGLKDKINRFVTDIIEYCCIMDKKLCEVEGYAFQFIELAKQGGRGLGADYEHDGSIPYVCPRCKKDLAKSDNSFTCDRCKIEYPIVRDIPIFISYRSKLKGIDSYIESKSVQESKKYIT